MSIWSEIITGVVTLLGTAGGMKYYFDYLLKKRKSTHLQEGSDFDKILKVWDDDNRRLRQREEELEKTVRQLTRDVNTLKNKILILESTQMDLPVPMWLKDKEGDYLAANKMYEEKFLRPNNLMISDLIGMTDEEMWPKDIANESEKNDRKAMMTGETLYTEESFLIGGKKVRYQVIKYVRYAGRAKIGIGGFAIPLKKNNETN